jgi:hypothetical protein
LPLDRHTLVSSIFSPSFLFLSHPIILFFTFTSNCLAILVISILFIWQIWIHTIIYAFCCYWGVHIYDFLHFI